MLTEIISRRVVAALALTAAAACGGGADATDPSDGPPDTPPASDVSPGVVTGVALDTHGQPIAGARIWVRPAVTTGLLQATTGGDGRYRVQGPSNIPYNAYAWTTVQYRGKSVCLRLASTNAADYDAFVPTNGVVRNFRLQLTGPIEPGSDNLFGGELRLFVPATPAGMSLMVTLTPDGPLVDGSTGQVLTFDARELLLRGIPVGVYKASAAFVAANGTRIPLDVNNDGLDGYASQATVQWSTDGSCVGSTGSGPDRAFLWIHDPSGE